MHGPDASVPDAEERVVLVDASDREIGTAEKLAAHRDGGRLHRAFSVFLFDAAGCMLVQRRAASKYHFPLLWTNACCGHPRPGEAVLDAAKRRLREELGVAVQPSAAFPFLYEAVDERTGLTEREYDHVLVGRLDAAPQPDPAEVAAVAWRAPAELLRAIESTPGDYTPWFRLLLPLLAQRGWLSGL
jgi:isopentenyl-diphosphate delta-isomerase